MAKRWIYDPATGRGYYSTAVYAHPRKGTRGVRAYVRLTSHELGFLDELLSTDEGQSYKMANATRRKIRRMYDRAKLDEGEVR